MAASLFGLSISTRRTVLSKWVGVPYAVAGDVGFHCQRATFVIPVTPAVFGDYDVGSRGKAKVRHEEEHNKWLLDNLKKISIFC